jgi:hypothetical protein
MTHVCRRLPIPMLAAITTLMLFVSGCTPPLNTDYADPKGTSINGVASFVELVKSSGRRAQVWRAASPRMKTEVDAIVMFQTAHGPIATETLEKVRKLMVEGSVSTLLIVVRDSDCAIDYWRQIAAMPDLSDKDQKAATESMQQAIVELGIDSIREFSVEEGELYGLKRANRSGAPVVIPVDVESDDGSIRVDSRWPLNRRLQPGLEAEALWSTSGEPLLTEEFDEYGLHTLVLASATPILNGGLVDPGNRQLAEELVKLLPEGGRVAITLSSRWSDGNFAESPSMLQFLKVHPHGWIFGQTLLALALFCWWKLPIFGRPRSAIDTEGARFGRHVEALGKLLQQTRDTAYARRILRDWQRAETPRRGSIKEIDRETLTSPSEEE